MRRFLLLIAVLALTAVACGDSAEPTTTTTSDPVVGSTTTTITPASTTTQPDGSSTTTTTGAQSTTTTVPADTTTTEPPTTTTTLPPTTTTTLPPTTTTVDPFGTTTTFPVQLPDGAFLSGNGLGVFDFGDDAEGVIAELTDALGPPLDDSGWSDAGDNLCQGSEVRFVIWDPIFVLMTDAATAYAPEGTRHFAFWAAFDQSPLATASGLVPQLSTQAEAEAALGAFEPEFNDLFELWLFTPDSGPEAGIQFEWLEQDNPDQILEALSAGQDDVCGE